MDYSTQTLFDYFHILCIISYTDILVYVSNRIGMGPFQ